MRGTYNFCQIKRQSFIIDNELFKREVLLNG